MAVWSAGSKHGDYFHAAESGRRWDEMEGRCGGSIISVLSLRHTKQAIWTAVCFAFYDTRARVPYSSDISRGTGMGVGTGVSLCMGQTLRIMIAHF